MAVTQPQSFPVERRRGWVETPDSHPRLATDVWDERRAEHVRVGRPRPGDASSPPWLVAAGGFAAHRSSPHWFGPVRYELRAGPAGTVIAMLDGVQWADWSRDGRLLMATADGRLQVRDEASLDVLWEHDLAHLTPDPQSPPESARG
jgi:hypothetical protein